MTSQLPMWALTDGGTAMVETALCNRCYTENDTIPNGAPIREFAQSLRWTKPDSEEFVDCGDNDALRCVGCGFTPYGEEADDD